MIITMMMMMMMIMMMMIMMMLMLMIINPDFLQIWAFVCVCDHLQYILHCTVCTSRKRPLAFKKLEKVKSKL